MSFFLQKDRIDRLVIHQQLSLMIPHLINLIIIHSNPIFLRVFTFGFIQIRIFNKCHIMPVIDRPNMLNIRGQLIIHFPERNTPIERLGVVIGQIGVPFLGFGFE